MENILDEIINKCHKEHITDVHFNVADKILNMEFRRNKKLVDYLKIYEHGRGFYEYLKYIAQLDLTMSNLPQSGTFIYYLEYAHLYCRLSVLESYGHQSSVLRILNMVQFSSLKDCIENESQSKLILNSLRQRNGLILFCGTTGSGKSTTMFTALNHFPDKKIYTLEDPIECVYENITQIQLNRRIGLTFDVGLKQLLRHNPDIIAIGEIRDEYEIKNAVRAALTGHLVVSTLHASSYQHIIARMIDLGVKPYEIKNTLKSIIYQSLDEAGKVKFHFIDNQEILDQVRCFEKDIRL